MPTITSKTLIDELKRLGYEFRMNQMDDSIEVSASAITDPIRAKIRRDLRDMGYNRYLTAAEDAYMAQAYEHSYHPIQEHLDSLVWDGIPRMVTLTSYFDENGSQQPVFETFFNRWFIGMIAKIYDNKQNVMFVLDGPQGIGKSYFIRWLASIFPPRFFIEKPINPNSKDDEVRLIKSVIWEVAELGATTRKTDREGLKHFISTKYITVRKPYGRHDITKPALASLFGTINNEAGFLSDPTGNRRFLVVTIVDINWEYQQIINLEQLWAEMINKYKTGQETEHITPDEIVLQVNRNEKYMIDDPFLIGLQQKCFADPTNTTDWASSNDILIFLGYDPPRRGDAMALSSAAKKLGLIKGKDRLTNKINGYYGIVLP